MQYFTKPKFIFLSTWFESILLNDSFKCDWFFKNLEKNDWKDGYKHYYFTIKTCFSILIQFMLLLLLQKWWSILFSFSVYFYYKPLKKGCFHGFVDFIEEAGLSKSSISQNKSIHELVQLLHQEWRYSESKINEWLVTLHHFLTYLRLNGSIEYLMVSMLKNIVRGKMCLSLLNHPLFAGCINKSESLMHQRVSQAEAAI